jgi:serine/threonine protein kinase
VQLDPGKLFGGDFRVVEPLKHGGMGSVYIVEQLQTGAKRALKLMHPQLVQDPKFRRRFEQEARIGAQIPSEHVVQVIAAGVDAGSGSAWLVMELLEGEDLDTCLRRRGQLPQAEAMEVLGQLCHALGAAHQVGIVHRDLKPANIFLAVARRRGVPFTVKVLDFGIAKIVAESSTTHTEAVGSPMWMAPEQTTQDHEILPATDVWALGLLTFRLLTGRYYWKAPNKPGATTAMLFREILIEPLPSAAQRAAEHGVAGLPKGFDSWFGRCVAREPHARFPNAADAFTALEKILSPRQQGQGPSAPIDVLGWKDGKDPNKKRRDSDDPSPRGAHRKEQEPTPKKASREVLAPVEMPPAREKTPPKPARMSQPPPAPKPARDQTPRKPFKDLDESIQRASRPPETPPTVRDRSPVDDIEPMSAEPMSAEPMPMSSEMTGDILSAPDTVPAARAAAALEMARAKEAEAAKPKPAETKPAAQARPAPAEAKEAAKPAPSEAREAAKPKPAEPKEIARPKASDPAAAPPPDDRAPRPSIPNPPSRTVAPVIDPAMLAPKPTPSDAGTAGPPAATAKPADPVASKPGAGPKSLTSSAPASTALSEPPVTPDVVETVSGIANTSPEMIAPKTPPKKLARIGVLAAAGGVALLIAVFGIRSFQKGQLERVCESEAAPGDATTTRIAACGDLCKAGSGIHCNAHGELLLQTPGAGGEVDKKSAAAAFQSACGFGYDPGCKRVAELSAETRSVPTVAPTSAPTAPVAPMIDIDAESSPVKHIMVMYKQSQGAPATIARTKEEARARALEALAKAKGGAKFDDLVRTYSDDAASKDRSGAPDAPMLGKLMSTLERMKTGDMDVIETSGGFHVVLRTEHPLPNAGVGSPSGFEPVKRPDPQPGNTTGQGTPTGPTTGPTTTPTPASTPTTTPTTTPTATPPATSTAAAGPPDEAAMRRALEPKVWNGNASLDEMRLLRAICTHMGDQQCRNRVNAMIQQKQANP